MSRNDGFCTVTAIKEYVNLRGTTKGPIFIGENGYPVTRLNVENNLKALTLLAGLDSKVYNTRSFQIGRTTDLAESQESGYTIKQAGRWHSKAYQKYIRPSVFTLPR